MTKVKSANRVLDILELLAQSRRSMTHAELARRTRIPKSSLTHILRNLTSRHYVEFDELACGYKLGESVFALARQGTQVRQMSKVAQPFLKSLTCKINESSSISVLSDGFAERIYSVRAERAVLYAMHVGVLAPLYANSAGKLFLAWMSPANREHYLATVPLLPLTPHTIVSATALRRQLSKIRNEGVAYSVGEFTVGMTGMSVPVLDAHGRILAAVGIATPQNQLTSVHSYLLHLRQCAKDIERNLEADNPYILA